MATNKLQWKRIAKGDKLPCQSFLRKKDGEILKLSTGAGVTVGQDAYYLPVDDVINVIKDYPVEESEDEKMIKYFKDLAPFDKAEELYEKYGFSHKDAIAWLEKQSEHANFINKIQIGDKVTRNEDGVLVNLSQLNRVAKKDEKQGEQKPADETKFKVGDWVVYCNDDVDLITGIEENGYCINNGGYIPFVCESDIRLWTIEDAKDGDVLVSESNCGLGTWYCIFKSLDDDESMTVYCYLSRDGRFETKKELCFDKATYNTKPATKEQRNTLLKAMADAGYTFDFEKKELKKIEQNPAWSEEDEEVHRKCICAMRASACGFPEEEKFVEQVDNWLKSLKDRYTWRPSDRQMSVLEHYMHTLVCNEHKEILFGLYTDLKKLKD